jgi:GWxTD domain-containing protein
VKLRIPFIAVLLALLSSCALFRPPEQDAGFATKSETQILFPEYLVSYGSGDTAVVHFRIPQNNLLFTRNPQDTAYTAYVEIRFRVMPALDGKVVNDSSTVSFSKVQQTGLSADWYGKFKVVIKEGYSGFLDLQLTDLSRQSTARNVLDIDRKNQNLRNRFMLCRLNDTIPLFRNFLLPGEKALLLGDGQTARLTVKYFRREFPLPPPPFSSVATRNFGYQADSLYEISGNRGIFEVSLPSRGFYYFQTDTALRSGFTLYRHADDFPYFSKAESMIPVLRFITTRQEYDELSYGTNKETALEDFWVRITGNSDRAKTVMSTYYGRAEQANKLFTCYTEGWRTDRGLIFLIFGQPNAVYRDPGTETWIYGEERSFKSLTFTFVKADNPYTANDYQLSRSELYKDEWYRGVDTWRQGRIYNDRP